MRLSMASRRQPLAAFRYLAEDASSGYGDAADRLVRAFRESGVRVEYRAWDRGGGDEAPRGSVRHSRDALPAERAARWAPTVAHLVPECLPEIGKTISGGPLISHAVWETDRLPRYWPEFLNQVDRVIVPTASTREVFVASGVTTPIAVVPSVACDPIPGDGGVPLRLAADLVTFYAIERWDRRMAPAAVVHAFLEAFTADDRVALVVKTTPRALVIAPEQWGAGSAVSGTTMLEVARIIRKYPHPPIVRVEVEEWAPERIAGLHTRGDCYVALSPGEGWGLGALDAAAYGNPVVMNSWGAQLTSLDTESAFLVDDQLEPVQRLEHAVELLRRVAADLGAARVRAVPLRERVLQDRAPARVAAMLLDAVPELSAAVDDAPRLNVGITAPATAPPLRGRSGTDELLLVGLTAGVWRSAFDNWVEMAERHQYSYELVSQEASEPYVPHATKWRLLRDYFESLPRARLVFYLDAADAFVCDAPAAVLARYRSYGYPLVFGAEHRSTADPSGETAEERWRFGNAGGYVGEAGVIADALRYGFELEDWESYGLVSDQRAMVLYLDLPENRHRATLDHRRMLVQNIAAAARYEEYDEHRVVLNRRPHLPVTSSLHFYGDNGRGYNLFARLYGLTPHELQETGRFRVPR